MRYLLIGMFTVGLAALSSSFGFADDYLVARESSGTETPREVRYWYGDGKGARVTDDFTIITRLDLGKAYMVNHATRTYSVSDISKVEDSPMDGQATVEVTDETRTISEWMCRKHLVKIPMGDGVIEMNIWASTDVAYDAVLYKQLIRLMASQMGMPGLKVMADIEGFPVLQEVSFGPVTTRQELISIESRTPPAGVYDPPAGYTSQSGKP